MSHPLRALYDKKKNDEGEKDWNHPISGSIERGIENVFGLCACDRVWFW